MLGLTNYNNNKIRFSTKTFIYKAPSQGPDIWVSTISTIKIKNRLPPKSKEEKHSKDKQKEKENKEPKKQNKQKTSRAWRIFLFLHVLPNQNQKVMAYQSSSSSSSFFFPCVLVKLPTLLQLHRRQLR
jgi:hypothetical protein